MRHTIFDPPTADHFSVWNVLKPSCFWRRGDLNSSGSPWNILFSPFLDSKNMWYSPFWDKPQQQEYLHSGMRIEYTRCELIWLGLAPNQAVQSLGSLTSWTSLVICRLPRVLEITCRSPSFWYSGCIVLGTWRLRRKIDVFGWLTASISDFLVDSCYRKRNDKTPIGSSGCRSWSSATSRDMLGWKKPHQRNKHHVDPSDRRSLDTTERHQLGSSSALWCTLSLSL